MWCALFPLLLWRNWKQEKKDEERGAGKKEKKESSEINRLNSLWLRWRLISSNRKAAWAQLTQNGWLLLSFFFSLLFFAQELSQRYSIKKKKHALTYPFLKPKKKKKTALQHQFYRFYPRKCHARGLVLGNKKTNLTVYGVDMFFISQPRNVVAIFPFLFFFPGFFSCFPFPPKTIPSLNRKKKKKVNNRKKKKKKKHMLQHLKTKRKKKFLGSLYLFLSLLQQKKKEEKKTKIRKVIGYNHRRCGRSFFFPGFFFPLLHWKQTKKKSDGAQIPYVWHAKRCIQTTKHISLLSLFFSFSQDSCRHADKTTWKQMSAQAKP